MKRGFLLSNENKSTSAPSSQAQPSSICPTVEVPDRTDPPPSSFFRTVELPIKSWDDFANVKNIKPVKHTFGDDKSLSFSRSKIMSSSTACRSAPSKLRDPIGSRSNRARLVVWGSSQPRNATGAISCSLKGPSLSDRPSMKLCSKQFPIPQIALKKKYVEILSEEEPTKFEKFWANVVDKYICPTNKAHLLSLPNAPGGSGSSMNKDFNNFVRISLGMPVINPKKECNMFLCVAVTCGTRAYGI
jgi:hypothetical protein